MMQFIGLIYYILTLNTKLTPHPHTIYILSEDFKIV